MGYLGFVPKLEGIFGKIVFEIANLALKTAKQSLPFLHMTKSL